MLRRIWLSLAVVLLAAGAARAADGYKNFHAAVYARVFEVQKMGDLDWLKKRFDVMERDAKIGKIYLETHRDKTLIDEATLEKAIAFFKKRGIKVAGGITFTVNERNNFQTFCYSDPNDRAWVKKVVEFTARHFDEIILDDFFFTSCKTAGEVKARGDKSWTDYRLDLMAKAARELVIGPAKAVNPRVKVIIKYPNWYMHFQGLGFNLETGPKDFDGIYTGTETRDAVRSAQHLQPYLGYQIFRYFDNLNPGHNRGGWIDTAASFTLDRYAEQLWLTMFAKAPEITLFDFSQLQTPISDRLRAPWQGQGTSFDYDKMMAAYKASGAKGAPTFALAAGTALDDVDKVLGDLGKPVGVASYRPYHSRGEDFLHDYLGMIGIPIDLRPEFPDDAHTILLTECAKEDPDIIKKIEHHLAEGGDVVITSGLLAALQDWGIHQIAEISVNQRKALVQDFQARSWGPLLHIDKPMIIPEIEYLTNDSWELVSAVAGQSGWPILHSADYETGHLYVLTIPDNFSDLYRLPPEVLTRIRQTVTHDLFVRLDGPSNVVLMVYDNDTFVVESFQDKPVTLSVVTSDRLKRITDLESGQIINGAAAARPAGFGRTVTDKSVHYVVTLPPHSWKAFKAE